jgi:hypothetical protein
MGELPVDAFPPRRYRPVRDDVVDVVAVWSAIGVEPAGRDEHGSAPTHLDAPSAVVDQVVVTGAEQHEVVEIRSAADGPGNDVVDLAASGSSAAAGVRAVPVAGEPDSTATPASSSAARAARTPA